MATKSGTTEAPMLNIGASLEAIKEARQAINDILKSGAEQETVRCALGTLAGLCSVHNTNVSNCIFTRNPTVPDKVK